VGATWTAARKRGLSRHVERVSYSGARRRPHAQGRGDHAVRQPAGAGPRQPAKPGMPSADRDTELNHVFDNSGQSRPSVGEPTYDTMWSQSHARETNRHQGTEVDAERRACVRSKPAAPSSSPSMGTRRSGDSRSALRPGTVEALRRRARSPGVASGCGRQSRLERSAAPERSAISSWGIASDCLP